MTKSIKDLAKEYNAEIYEDEYAEKRTGKLMRTFSPDSYEESLSLNSEGTHYYNHVDSTEEESEKYNSWVCSSEHNTESVVEFKNGKAVAASYSYVCNNTSSDSFGDDVDGVINFWSE